MLRGSLGKGREQTADLCRGRDRRASYRATSGGEVVHRDLKPSNIFVTFDGVVKILDFGLARTVGGAAREEPALTITAATQPGALIGAPAYLSPEQARGEPADARSDIFSFGCVLYEMVVGQCAFPGDTPAELFPAILKDEPRDISETGKTVSG